MSDIEIQLTLAGAVITVWLSLLVAAMLWLGRAGMRQARLRARVIARAARSRTRVEVFQGVDALVSLGVLVVGGSIAVFLLTVGPLVLAVIGLDLTLHLVKVSH